eukprot:PhF_6_TR15105/c0_g1_i1/m.23781
MMGRRSVVKRMKEEETPVKGSNQVAPPSPTSSAKKPRLSRKSQTKGSASTHTTTPAVQPKKIFGGNGVEEIELESMTPTKPTRKSVQFSTRKSHTKKSPHKRDRSPPGKANTTAQPYHHNNSHHHIIEPLENDAKRRKRC